MSSDGGDTGVLNQEGLTEEEQRARLAELDMPTSATSDSEASDYEHEESERLKFLGSLERPKETEQLPTSSSTLESNRDSSAVDPSLPALLTSVDQRGPTVQPGPSNASSSHPLQTRLPSAPTGVLTGQVGAEKFPSMTVGMITGQTPVNEGPATTASNIGQGIPIGSMVNVRRENQGPVVIVPASSFYNANLAEDFKALAEFGTNVKCSMDWDNERLKKLHCIDLNEYWVMSEEERIQLLCDAMNSLTSEISVSSVGKIMLGAWGLVSCEDTRINVFQNSWKDVKPDNVVSYKTLPEDVVKSAITKVAKFTPKSMENLRVVRTACFYCAAFLRLVTKDTAALDNARVQIQDHYSNFYQEGAAFGLVVDKDILVYMRKIFQNRELIKNSVGPFLLAFQELTGQNKGMCKMLYEIHMGFTGIHAYGLFIANADKLAVPYHILMGFLSTHTTRSALITIKDILLKYESKNIEDNVKRQKSTWIYSRIFDHEMFSTLQTKNCRFLTSILASIADKLGSTNNTGTGKTTSIKQLEKYYESNRNDIDEWADRIIKCCNEAVWEMEDKRNKIFSVPTSQRVA